MKLPVWILLSILLITSIAATSNSQITPEWKKYWYSGKAELARYSLEQARYGEIHKGEAVLIFVTEPFLKDKQVKLESGNSSPNAISVLKLNFTRKFYTGIYPYSLMTSVFTPVDNKNPRTLKATSSSQEWCGHTYAQLNLRDDHYQTLVRSYFEEEVDQNFEIKAAWLEDEIFTRIRLAPDTLPKGNIDIVPSLQFSRLWHVRLKPEQASASLTTDKDGNVYTIQYKDLKRQVKIHFNKAFPYEISGWEEQHPGGFGGSAILTTRAVKTNTLLLDYWNKHNNEDAGYRQKLGVRAW